MAKLKDNEEEEKEQNKKCFVIMPISDHPDYTVGHFGRVYEHIIKPACLEAGFEPIRADDVKSTNYIALDILNQILKCEMAVCDLSSKNANVLYEAGIRQAFNMPITFIKDNRTTRIFDIQGFRTMSYDENLRIDNVSSFVPLLSETINATIDDKNGINSLVTLLGIEPAKVKTTEISGETELILAAIKSIKSERPAHTIYPKELIPIPQDGREYNEIIDENYSFLKPGDTIWTIDHGDLKYIGPHSKDTHIKVSHNNKPLILNKNRRKYFKIN